jgi:hypothetical protein
MTTKETSLLRHGIHSELFLVAYSHPDTIYGIAKRHQDTENRPDTSKTGKALEKLEKAGYLYSKNKKYHPNIERLSKELSEYLSLEEINLTDREFTYIQQLLTKNDFFILLYNDVLYRILTQPPRIHHIDALQVICNNIGMMCTFFMMARKNNEQIVTAETKRKSISKISDELDKDIETVYKKMKYSVKGSKSIRKKKMNTVTHINNSMKSYILGNVILDKFQTETLEKLANLWEQHDGFQAGIETSGKI